MKQENWAMINLEMLPADVILKIIRYLSVADLMNVGIASNLWKETIQFARHPCIIVEHSMWRMNYNGLRHVNNCLEELGFLKIKKLHLRRITTPDELLSSFTKKIDIQHLVAFKSLSKVYGFVCFHL